MRETEPEPLRQARLILIMMGLADAILFGFLGLSAVGTMFPGLAVPFLLGAGMLLAGAFILARALGATGAVLIVIPTGIWVGWWLSTAMQPGFEPFPAGSIVTAFTIASGLQAASTVLGLAVAIGMMRQKEEPTSSRRGLGCLIEGVLVVAILVIIYTFVAQPFRVEQDSMVPTIDPGDWVLIDKVTPGISSYARGDIVLVKQESLGIFSGSIPAHLTRIIGQPGDTVDFDNGMVYVTPPDGPRREEGAAPPDLPPVYRPDGTVAAPQRLTEHWTLQADEYFVIGDNRPELDPYFYWGPRKRQGIEGRVRVWYFPDWFGIFDPPTYAGLE